MSEKIKKISKRFRLIKYFSVLVILVTLSLVLYYIFDNQNKKISHNKAASVDNKVKSIADTSFKATEPDVLGINVDQGPYFIKAKEMQELSGIVSFNLPEAKIMLKHIDWLNIKSKKAKLTLKDNNLQLFEQVKGNLNKTYYFEGQQAEIVPPESIIKSYSDIKLFSKEGVLKSKKGFWLNYESQTAFFHGDIEAHINREKDNTRVDIKSDKLDVFWQKRKGDFIRNVILTKDGSIVKADKMTAFIGEHSKELEKVYAYGNVRIIDENQEATGEYGEYIVSKSLLILKNNVTLNREGSIVKGELLHYNFEQKKADLVGSPKDDSNSQRVKAIIIPKKKND